MNPTSVNKIDRLSTVAVQQRSYQQKDTTMTFTRQVQLINEALSRARMRSPQTANSEATRPARQIMMTARRREQNRLMGL